MSRSVNGYISNEDHLCEGRPGHRSRLRSDGYGALDTGGSETRERREMGARERERGKAEREIDRQREEVSS